MISFPLIARKKRRLQTKRHAFDFIIQPYPFPFAIFSPRRTFAASGRHARTHTHTLVVFAAASCSIVRFLHKFTCRQLSSLSDQRARLLSDATNRSADQWANCGGCSMGLRSVNRLIWPPSFLSNSVGKACAFGRLAACWQAKLWEAYRQRLPLLIDAITQHSCRHPIARVDFH